MTRDELLAAFWSNVDKKGLHGCWRWTGRKNTAGYGWVRHDDISEKTGGNLAHRVAWDITHPEKLCKGWIVAHTCDNPACINPEHLFLATRKDNNRDATVKGRAVIPTPDQVEQTGVPMIVDENIAEPGDDIARVMEQEIPQTDIPARRVATEKAFRERDALVVAISKLLPSHLMRSQNVDIAAGAEWQWIVCVHGPAGMMNWRIHARDLPHYSHLGRVEQNYWDGHNTKTKYERLGALDGSVEASETAIAEHCPKKRTKRK